ncbi:MAG: hypothetical protein ACI9HX_001439 [Pseudoalteromonas tetraodonis]|jgi:hypothetical protein
MIKLHTTLTAFIAFSLAGCTDWKGAAVQAVENAEAPSAKSQQFGLAAVLKPDPYRSVMYLGDSDHNFVHILDVSTMAIQESLYVGGQPVALTVTDGGRYLKVELAGIEQYAIIDLEKRSVITMRQSQSVAGR